MPIYSISGTTANPIIVPHSTIYKTPAWSVSVAIKVVSDLEKYHAFGTGTGGEASVYGFTFFHVAMGVYMAFNYEQRPVAGLGPGEWNVCGTTFDGVTRTSYQNGNSSGGGPWGGQIPMQWETNPLWIAAVDAPSCRYANPRMFNRCLTQPEMAILAAGGEVTDGLVLRWWLAEGSGQTINEDINGLHGVTTGAISWNTDVPPGTPPEIPGGGGATGKAGFRSPLIDSPLLIRGV